MLNPTTLMVEIAQSKTVSGNNIKVRCRRWIILSSFLRINSPQEAFPFYLCGLYLCQFITLIIPAHC